MNLAIARNRRRRPFVGPVLLSLMATTGCGSVAVSPNQPVNISDLASNPGAFDGKPISVTGRVADTRVQGGGRTGLRRIYELSGDSQVITVIAPGSPACRLGATATVDGRFSNRNGLIEATWVAC
jgi:hypothetical protein